MVRMQSVFSSFPVPSCPCEKGVDIELHHFASKLKSILSEMASL